MGKTLVTGAAGFIGSHVVRELLEEGREIRALVLPKENRLNIEGLDLEVVEGDITDRDSVQRAFQGVDRVFHLAAIYALWLPRRELMYEVNCLGAMNVCWAALRKSVEKIVFTSSIAAIGLNADGSLADETTPYNHQGNHNDYITSKWLSEEHAKTFAAEGLPIVFCNPTGPIGPRDIGPTPTGQSLVELLNGRLRFYFNSGINLVDVEDVARGHVLAEKKGRVGERYLLANENLTMKDLFTHASEATGVRFSAMPLPLEATIPLGDAWEAYADRVSHKKPLVTGDSLRYLRKPMTVSNQKAREELGLEFRPLDDSIRRAVDWFVEHGYVKNQKFLRQYRRGI